MCQDSICSLFYNLLLKIEAPGHRETVHFSQLTQKLCLPLSDHFPSFLLNSFLAHLFFSDLVDFVAIPSVGREENSILITCSCPELRDSHTSLPLAFKVDRGCLLQIGEHAFLG